MSLAMMLLGVVTVALLRQAARNSWAKPSAVACAAFALFLAVTGMFSPIDRLGRAKATLAAHDHYQDICGKVVDQDLEGRGRLWTVSIRNSEPEQPTRMAQNSLENHGHRGECGDTFFRP
jgi:hypothetical protein